MELFYCPRQYLVKIQVFWDVTYQLTKSYQHYAKAQCLHFQSLTMDREDKSTNFLQMFGYVLTSQHGVISQRATIFVNTVRTLNPPNTLHTNPQKYITDTLTTAVLKYKYG
jgi:hypothetical protein